MTWLYIGLVAAIASVVFYAIERHYQPPAPRGCAKSPCANICRGSAECQVRTRFEPTQFPSRAAFQGCNCRGLEHDHTWGIRGCSRP